MRRISILGATGSIGQSTLSLLDDTRADAPFEIVALTGGRNVRLLAEQALKYRPEVTVIADEDQYQALKDALSGSGLKVAAGADSVEAAAKMPCDWIMAAIVGIAGLKPVWAAASTGAVLALANKESLVCAGPALLARVKAHGGTLLPVDSEHNAIFQVFDRAQKDAISQLILTASGGPFLGWPREALTTVTRAQALKHPNWSMGEKITIDSATLANKGLELIEAAYLFDMPESAIDVVVHPQSIIHSMVAYRDGSYLAQMGAADMRIPISYALNWPKRTVWNAPKLDFTALARLDFKAPDVGAFPMLALAREALKTHPLMPIVYNAANEMQVQAFLKGAIGFCDIAKNVESAMMKAQLTFSPYDTLGSQGDENRFVAMVLEIDQTVRRGL